MIVGCRGVQVGGFDRGEHVAAADLVFDRNGQAQATGLGKHLAMNAGPLGVIVELEAGQETDGPGNVVRFVFGTAWFGPGAAKSEIAGGQRCLGVLQVVGRFQVLECFVKPIELGQRQAQPAQDRQGRGRFLKEVPVDIGSFLVVAQAVLGLPSARKPCRTIAATSPPRTGQVKRCCDASRDTKDFCGPGKPSLQALSGLRTHRARPRGPAPAEAPARPSPDRPRPPRSPNRAAR